MMVLMNTDIIAAIAAVPTAIGSVIAYLVAGTMYEAPTGVTRSGAFAATVEYVALLPGRAPANYVGRCKRCRKGVAVVDAVRGTSRLNTKDRRCDLVLADQAGRIYQAADHGTNPCAYWAPCKCGGWVVVKHVAGSVTDHVCGAKCMASTGPNCDCSCGGRNHGRSFAAI